MPVAFVAALQYLPARQRAGAKPTGTLRAIGPIAIQRVRLCVTGLSAMSGSGVH
jgi:hypothetical protein